MPAAAPPLRAPPTTEAIVNPLSGSSHHSQSARVRIGSRVVEAPPRPAHTRNIKHSHHHHNRRHHR
eukprot:COSAG01_NODE_4790_length_4733_cov_15.070674_3_plen_66_part_00